MTLDELRAQLYALRLYPQSLGLSCTALGEGGGWRQGYEHAIDDVLRLVDEDCGAQPESDRISASQWLKRPRARW